MATKIDWADDVWNPVWGCLFNCRYCYARGMAKRFGKTGAERSFTPVWKLDNFNKKFASSVRRVFVNSMSDVVFWKPDWWKCVLDRICDLPDIDFVFLTKGHSYPALRYPPNVILGYTITMRNTSDEYMPVPGVRMLYNCEPILEPMGALDAFTASSCQWLILGAETGNHKDKVTPDILWVQALLASCLAEGVPIFMKDNMLECLGGDVIPDIYRQYPGRL